MGFGITAQPLQNVDVLRFTYEESGQEKISYEYKDTPNEEDALAAPPIKVAYPFPVYSFSAEEAPNEEPPAAIEEEMLTSAPTEDFPTKEYLIAEEAPPAAQSARSHHPVCQKA